MENLTKKENFKLLIKEFHAESLPPTIERDLEIPLFHKKIISIFGPRRAGKSFYFYTLCISLTSFQSSRSQLITKLG